MYLCLSIAKISPKVLNKSASLLVEVFSLTQGLNCLRPNFLNLVLSDNKRSRIKGHYSDFTPLHLTKEFGHMLLLNTNRKSYMRNPAELLDLTVKDIERSKPRLGTEIPHD